MAKMNTIKHLAVGSVRLRGLDEARIERNLFAENGHTFEALRFCKNRNGRHNRVHLVIDEQDFVALFAEAVRNRVFGEGTLTKLRAALSDRGETTAKPSERKPGANPLLDLIGVFADGSLAQEIDEELYGKDSL